MKVVFLNPSGQLGGAERVLLDMVGSLRRANPELQLHLVLGEEGPLVSMARAEGAKVTVVPYPHALAQLGDAAVRGPAGDRISRWTLARQLVGAVPSMVGYLRTLRQVLRRIGPDIIHTNGFKMHVLGVWTRPRNVPVIWHIHDYVSSRVVMSRLLRRHAGQCAAAVANSRSVEDDLRRVCGPGLALYTIYNGIDLEEFSPEGPVLDLDARAGLAPAPAGTVRVGLVATLGRWKGHAVFLRALAQLPPGLPIRAYVVGGALYQTGGSQYSLESLRTMTRQLGIEDRVGFTGFVLKPAAAMRALDIVVHASTEPEPFGLVIVEAMAAGRALIASRAGGSAELFEDGADALGCPPGDVDSLAHAMERLINDPELRTRLAHTGRATAEQRFGRARLATELLPIYRRVLDEAS
jgi:glycosyltransferase involved in cell wall biosynthesis